jgi:hypothetical protein
VPLSPEESETLRNNARVTKIAALCIGELPTDAARQSFWESVVFYNYVLEFPGNAPRIRPTPLYVA